MTSNSSPKKPGQSVSENNPQRRRIAADRQNTAASPEGRTGQRRSVNQRPSSAPVSAQRTAADRNAAAAQRTQRRPVSQNAAVSQQKNAGQNPNTVRRTAASQNPAVAQRSTASQRTMTASGQSRPISAADRPPQTSSTPLPGKRTNYNTERRAAHRAAQNRRIAAERAGHTIRPSAPSAAKPASERPQDLRLQPQVQNKRPDDDKKTPQLKSKHRLKNKKNGSKKTASGKSPIAALRNYMAHWPEYSTKKKVLSIMIAIAVFLITAFLLFSLVEIITTPKLNLDNFNYIQGTQILDKNGAAYQNLETSEYRELVTIDQIPEHVKNAFVDIEDQRFYSHNGVDFKGLARAVLSVFTSGSLDGPGGSTITQQLIKQTHLSSEKTINRKYHEIVLALQLENVYTKDQILEAYLNKINLSQAWGIQSAAKTYFNTDVSQLTLAQAAMLAAMPKSPSYYDPYVYDDNGSIVRDANGQCKLSEENRTRAITVLDKMLELNHITQAERDQAVEQIKANNVGLTYVAHTNTYSYFTEGLYDEVLSDLVSQKNMTEEEASEYLLTGGLTIYSTVDPEVQTAMETAAADDDLFPSQSSAAAAASEAKSADTGEEVNYIPQVAMTVIDNSTGAVAGMVGGRTKTSNLTLNRATRRFQPGSSTKPLTTYGPGIDTGAITLATLYDDVAISYEGWTPQNSEGGHSGRITVRQGIINSLNTIAAQACIATGIETCASYAEKVGLYINREDNLDVNPASLALGGYSEGQTTLAMASAFSSFANKGVHKSYSFYTKVTDASGNIILEEKTTDTQVYSEQTAYLITDVLQQAINGGTTTISCDQPIAGKTGTTDDLRHAWICGYTPYYSMAVWYGYDENIVETSQGTFELNIGVYGGSKPGPGSMLETVMRAINNNKEAASFNEKPEGITTATIDTISGKLATDLSSAAGHTKTELFASGTAPTAADDSHYTANVCSVSGKLAGAYCPASTVTSSVFYRAPSLFPNGITGNALSSNLAPTDTCTVHTKPVTTTPTDNSTGNSTGTGTGDTGGSNTGTVTPND